jgi:hypothetical protein
VRRRRRWWLFGLLLLAFLIGGYYWLFYLAHRELDAALAEVDRLDPGWRLEDLEAAREVLPPEQNSAPQVMIARSLFQRKKTGRDKLGLSNGLSPEVQLNEQQRKALQAEMAKVPRAFAEARKLKDLPRGRHDVKHTKNILAPLPPYQMDTLLVAKLLDWDVQLLAQDNDGDAAVDSCRAILNTGRSFGDDPSLMSFLVRQAIHNIAVGTVQRTLAQTEPSPAALRELQRLLEDEVAVPLAWIAARGERASSDRLMNAVQTGDVDYWAFRGSSGLSKVNLFDLQMMCFPGALARTRTAWLRFTTQLVEATKLPTYQQLPRLRELQKEEPQLALQQFPGILIRYFLDSGKEQAQLRCALVAVAAERYRREHGRWPESCAALVTAGLLKEVPTGPFDGRPVRLRRLDDRLVVYTANENGKDNGGNVTPAPRNAGGLDLGIQLWDVPHRRQPPRPPVTKAAAKKAGA